jgi:hypothetical protein
MFNGETHYKWPFSIAMLNYQRVLVTSNDFGRQSPAPTWKFFVHHLLVRRAVTHAEAVELGRQRQALLDKGEGKTITVSGGSIPATYHKLQYQIPVTNCHQQIITVDFNFNRLVVSTYLETYESRLGSSKIVGT